MERTIFTNRWYAMKPSRMVQRKPVRVPFLGGDLVVWRNRDKQVVVQDDTCPHRGARLSMGKVARNGCIECPYHGWQFDSDGALTSLPADSTSNLVGNTHISSFETVEMGGLVWACMGNLDGPRYSPPVIKEMHSRDWVYVTGEETFDADWVTTLENSIDVSHVNFVHSDFGDPDNGHVEIDAVRKRANDRLVLESTICHKSENLLLKFTENPEVRVTHDIFLPNTVSIKFWVRDIMQVITYVTYTPLKDNKTLVNWVFLRKPKVPLLDGLLNASFDEGMQRAIREDKAIVESISNPPNRVNTVADRIQVLFRRELDRLMLSEPSAKYI